MVDSIISYDWYNNKIMGDEDIRYGNNNCSYNRFRFNLLQLHTGEEK